MKKHAYIDLAPFIRSIIEAFGISNASQQELDELHDAIFDRLSIRCMETLFDQLGPRELTLIEKLTEDHPEMDRFDALMIAAKDIQGLEQKLAETIEITTVEMVAEAQAVDEYMKQRESTEKTN